MFSVYTKMLSNKMRPPFNNIYIEADLYVYYFIGQLTIIAEQTTVSKCKIE